MFCFYVLNVRNSKDNGNNIHINDLTYFVPMQHRSFEIHTEVLITWGTSLLVLCSLTSHLGKNAAENSEIRIRTWTILFQKRRSLHMENHMSTSGSRIYTFLVKKYAILSRFSIFMQYIKFNKTVQFNLENSVSYLSHVFRCCHSPFCL